MAEAIEKAPMPHAYWVYILASRRNGTLYTGVSNDLARRVHEHKTKVIRGFTAHHDVSKLVWYEEHSEIDDAIAREKKLKRWRRDWKLQLIEAANPRWIDLYETLSNRN